METTEKYIDLYPGHWLYNAGVIGFLAVLKKCNYDVEQLLQNDGTLKGDITVVFDSKCSILIDNPKEVTTDDEKSKKGFEIPNVIWEWFMASGDNLKKDFNENSNDPVKDIWGTLFNVVYRGFYNANSNLLYAPSKTSPAIIYSFLGFFNTFLKYGEENSTCSFCTKKGSQTYKNRFSSEHYKELGGSDGTKGMPNSFWSNEKSVGGTPICDTCSFLLLSRHLSFTTLNDWTKIFINAPSFKLMYELNKFINNSFEWRKNKDNKSLLAMSVIEYCSKTNATLGLWLGMNIEIVAITKKIKENGQYDDVIEYYSIPSSVTKLFSNKRIATLLSDIGEFKILNLVLEEKYKDIVEIAYRILKISMKDDFNKGDQKYIDDFLFLSRNKYNKTAQRLVANKILKLYALIDERIKNN